MSSLFQNEWFKNYAVEFSAALIIWLATLLVAYFFGNFIERRRKIRQFYDAIKPAVKTISEVCKSHRVPKSEIKKLVQSVSGSFSHEFLGKNFSLLVKKDVKYDAGEILDCGICDDTITVAEDICPNCRLDCCAWSFSNRRNQGAQPS